VTWVALLTCLLAWGHPIPVAPSGDYLGVVERIEGSPPWARVVFRRASGGDWVPTTPRPHDLNALTAAAAALPQDVAWHACRDSRALGPIGSKSRKHQLFADLGTQRLGSLPGAVAEAAYDDRFAVFGGRRAIRPFVISTLPDACAVGQSVREVDGAQTAGRVARELQTIPEAQLRKSQAWQVGHWTVIEIEYEIPQDLALRERVLGGLTEQQLRRAKLRSTDLPKVFQGGTTGGMVVVVVGQDVRVRIPSARIVDWISVDDDPLPDLMIRTSGYNRDGYLLLYDSFTKQAAFEWRYH
jgi:hypothetical protein